jgi:phosphatidylglycerophosphate synthase
MPEPFNNKQSLDKYIYNAINQLPKIYCVLEPNQITLFNYLITFLIAYLIYYDYSYLAIIIIVIFRQFLDILDGAIARKCNKYSKLGEKLDIYGDYLLAGLLIIIFYLKSKNKYIQYGYTILFIYCIIRSVYAEMNKNLYTDDLMIFMHDNTILTVPLLIIIGLISINIK